MLKANTETATIRILVIEDQELFLAGLRSLIQSECGLTVVGQAHNRTEALRAARAQPDVILLDLDFGSENSLDFLPDLLKVARTARVLAVTGIPDPELHLHAVRLGAMGIVLKAQSAEVLLKAIRKVHAGEVWLNRSMVTSVINRLVDARATQKVDQEADKIASLTGRELQVIGLVAEGRRNKQIGERLFISDKTVRHHLTSIFNKVGVTDRLELLIYSYHHGLAKMPARPVAMPASERPFAQSPSLSASGKAAASG